jgi:hypothetical protein
MQHHASGKQRTINLEIIAADGAGEQGDVQHPREFLSDVRQE